MKKINILYLVITMSIITLSCSNNSTITGVWELKSNTTQGDTLNFPKIEGNHSYAFYYYFDKQKSVYYVSEFKNIDSGESEFTRIYHIDKCAIFEKEIILDKRYKFEISVSGDILKLITDDEIMILERNTNIDTDDIIDAEECPAGL